ncbi:MAG TPA: 2-oxoacid:acceptor oxidoreductase family protein, partial [Bacteroidales bacterium]|nr:2-oxoacid:acceptor oxidoreductase family protein [Bacteroidales bacterium]
DTAIVLNQPSLDKFEKMVKPGGLLLYDPNGITSPPSRTDINIYKIAATDTAIKMGYGKVFNMMVLGGFIKIKPIVKIENVMAGLKKSLPVRNHNLLPMNEEAITKGLEIVEAVNVL